MDPGLESTEAGSTSRYSTAMEAVLITGCVPRGLVVVAIISIAAGTIMVVIGGNHTRHGQWRQQVTRTGRDLAAMSILPGGLKIERCPWLLPAAQAMLCSGGASSRSSPVSLVI